LKSLKHIEHGQMSIALVKDGNKKTGHTPRSFNENFFTEREVRTESIRHFSVCEEVVRMDTFKNLSLCRELINIIP